MRQVKPESPCENSEIRMHNWVVYSHDAKWWKLGCMCTRCGAAATMTDRVYQLHADKRNDAWIQETHRRVQAAKASLKGSSRVPES